MNNCLATVSIGQLFGKDEETQLQGSPKDDEDLCFLHLETIWFHHFWITTVDPVL